MYAMWLTNILVVCVQNLGTTIIKMYYWGEPLFITANYQLIQATQLEGHSKKNFFSLLIVIFLLGLVLYTKIIQLLGFNF